MFIEVFALAKRVEILDDGMMDVSGIGMSQFTTKKFPASFKMLPMALRLRFRTVEEGKHKIDLKLVDTDGDCLSKLSVEAQTESFSPDGYSSCNIRIAMQNVHFKTAGSYSMDMAINGLHVASCPFSISLEE